VLSIGQILASVVQVLRGGGNAERPALFEEERVGVEVVSEELLNVIGETRGLAGDCADVRLEPVRHASPPGAEPRLRDGRLPESCVSLLPLYRAYRQIGGLF
jgi:hypothetical protein